MNKICSCCHPESDGNMITIFLTVDLNTTNFGKITKIQIDERSLVKTESGLYRYDIGFEGSDWHRNLGKAKERVRRFAAERINELKAEISKIKKTSIELVTD
jgi:hypothetical protein